MSRAVGRTSRLGSTGAPALLDVVLLVARGCLYLVVAGG